MSRFVILIKKLKKITIKILSKIEAACLINLNILMVNKKHCSVY